MGLFGSGAGQGRSKAMVRLEALEAEARNEAALLEAMREGARERDEERRLLLQVLAALKPGQHPRILAETLFQACCEPLELSTFYVALVDYGTDRISFPFYFEGGKARNPGPRPYSSFGGLTGKVLAGKAPRHYPSQEDQERDGVNYTEAERLTGLIPQSWYGVPMGVGRGWEDQPFGMMAFECFRRDAFSPSRRALMDALAALLALALKADPGRGLGFQGA